MPVTKAEDRVGFHGGWEGAAHGASICVIANRIEIVGACPRLHIHENGSFVTEWLE